MPNFNNNITNEELNSVNNAIDPVVFYASFNWLEKMVFGVMIDAFQRTMYTTLGRLLHNTTMYLTMFYINFMPIFGFRRFGIRKSYVNMTEEDIAIPGILRTNKEVLELLYKKN